MKLFSTYSVLRLSFFSLLFLFPALLFAQSNGVLIDYAPAPLPRSASAVMELRSGSQGFLAPQVILTATNVSAPIVTPFNGLMVYNTNATGSGPVDVQPGYYYWNGTGWTRFMNGNSSVISGSGAATRVAFWDGTNSLSSDADLYWDNNTLAKRLGIGTATPGRKLDVNGDSRFRNTIYFGATDNEGLISWTGDMGNSEAGLVIRGQASRGILLGANTSSHVMINNAGSVGIGTATGPGQKLDVAGGSIRTTHQLMSTIATGTSPLAVTSTTLNTNLNADLLDGWHASQLQFQQSNRDFPNGTLIQTDIDYSGVSGDPWLLEIEGNAYGNLVPIDIKIQGYFWTSTMINVGGISNGTNITGISLFNYGGKLCFWFPNQAYWQGYSVFVNDNYAGIKHNRLVSITHEAKPVAITREVALTSVIRQSWHSGNFDPTTYTPITGGTGYIQNQVAADQAAGFRINGNGLFNGGSVGIGTTAPGGYRLNVQGGAAQTLIQSASDATLVLKGTDTWSGITFSDVNGSDNLWYNGQNSTFAIGGGGSNVSGKKLHIDGATSIGSTYDADAAPTDGLIVKGNVGIGTINPLLKVRVEGDIEANDQIRATGWLTGTGTGPGAEIGVAGSYAYFHGYNRTAGAYIPARIVGTTIDMRHSDASSDLFVDATGNVGIGTATPATTLHVYSTSSAPVAIQSTTAESDIVYANSTGASWEVGTNNNGNGTGSNQFYIYDNAYRMTVQAGTGNVGINTTAPTQLLDVNGSVRIRGGSPDVGKVLTATDVNGNANWGYPGNPWVYVGNDVREVCNTAYRDEFEWGVTYNNDAPILRVTCNRWNVGQRVCTYPPYPTGDAEPFVWGGACWIWGTNSAWDNSCSRYYHSYYQQDANGKFGMVSGNGCDANPGVYRRRL